MYTHSIRVTEKSQVEGLPESTLSLAADTGTCIYICLLMWMYASICMYL